MDYLDDEMEPDPQLLKLTNAIIGAAIAVHSQLGAGFDESTYDKALALEFAARGIPFISQHIIRVIYRGQEVGQYRLDFLVADAVVVEIKSVDSLAPIHTAQVISYLKSTKFKLAILINFNVRLLKDGIKRVSLKPFFLLSSPCSLCPLCSLCLYFESQAASGKSLPSAFQ